MRFEYKWFQISDDDGIDAAAREGYRLLPVAFGDPDMQWCVMEREALYQISYKEAE